MTRLAGVEAVVGAPRPVVLPTIVLIAWSTFFFIGSGLAVRLLGSFTPDIGVLLVVALTARPGSRPFLVALAVGAGRIAIGVDPPVAVIAGYFAVAAVHASLGEIIDADRLAVRLLGVTLSTFWVVMWLCIVHVLRSDVPLELMDRAPGLALRTTLTTAILAPVVIPVLRTIPGIGSYGRSA